MICICTWQGSELYSQSPDFSLILFLSPLLSGEYLSGSRVGLGGDNELGKFSMNYPVFFFSSDHDPGPSEPTGILCYGLRVLKDMAWFY